MSSTLLIWGAGGPGKVVLDVALQSHAFENVLFLDDDPAKAGLTFCGCRVIGGIGELQHLAGSAFVVAIGDNRFRASCFDHALASGLLPETLIHPTAVISNSATVAPGTVVMPGVIVNAAAVIAEDCILNSGAIIEHDCRIGSHVHIAPRAVLGGGVSVGSFAHIGIGATILPMADIGDQSTVGAGAVVLHGAPAGSTVIGVPAKALSYA